MPPIDLTLLLTLAGTAVLGLYALRLTVLRQDRRLDTAIIQVTVDNTPPTARITYPAPQQRFSLAQAGVINFQAEAADAAGLARLEWILDGQLLGETRQPPYLQPWQPVAGEHQLVVRAYDLAGNQSQEATVSFWVEP